MNEPFYFIDDEIICFFEPVAEPSTTLEKKQTQKSPLVLPVQAIPVIAASPKKDLLSHKPSKKIVVMAYYKNSEKYPQEILSKLNHTFMKLNQDINEVTYLNAAFMNTGIIEQNLGILILLGGTGKNLDMMKSYSGKREIHTIIEHDGVKILFAKAMENYANDRQGALKFWTLLQELFILKK